ncbi:hypothetical protein RUM43_007653 [Polyplax serrata]|uniref:Uncharacterized protein n=1 Tax=Polyplax serrata TaxID=468196 RepID=A0AAN8P8Y4_POLSC
MLRFGMKTVNGLGCEGEVEQDYHPKDRNKPCAHSRMEAQMAKSRVQSTSATQLVLESIDSEGKKKSEGNVHDLPCSDDQLIPLYVEEELRVESHLRIRKSARRAQNICNGTNQIFVKFADVKTNRETVSVAVVTHAYRT